MQQLPEALAPLAEYPQFILYKLVPSKKKPGKFDKLPVDFRTLQVFKKGDNWQQDPAARTTAAEAIARAALCGSDYGVGFFFTPEDPFFFLDIDGCLEPDNATWSPVALDLINRLPGAAVEISQSGRGLHIFGTYAGAMPAHACKNVPLGLELYTSARFVALTGRNTVGSVGRDCTATLTPVVAGYFPPKGTDQTAPQDWTTEPVPEWTGPEDDDELVRKALASQSAASVFEGRS
ncbi:MAG: hypothetical protein KAJ19_29085, partial [Gammaproteobacteria bacterium]|nr:hypothetical protein [Gammaproteobacteria bacterium]